MDLRMELSSRQPIGRRDGNISCVIRAACDRASRHPSPLAGLLETDAVVLGLELDNIKSVGH